MNELAKSSPILRQSKEMTHASKITVFCLTQLYGGTWRSKKNELELMIQALARHHQPRCFTETMS